MSTPLTGEDCALLQQAYLKYLIASDDLFDTVPVLAEDDGNLTSQMDIALGIITEQGGSGRAGACVVIRQPNGDDQMPGVQFPPLNNDWEILCLEWREINRHETKGTNVRAWHMARRIHRLIKEHRAPGLIQNFTMRHPTISRTTTARELPSMTYELVGYMLRLACPEADLTEYTKTALPVLSGAPALTPGTPSVPTGAAGTVLTVTCATAGATIYYTTDLSCPANKNPLALVYATPITVGAGTYMFRAEKTGSIGSNTVTAQFT